MLARFITYLADRQDLRNKLEALHDPLLLWRIETAKDCAFCNEV